MPERCDIAAIVVCGGASRRFGQDKTALQIEAQTVLQRTCDLVAPLVCQLYIVGHNNQSQALAAQLMERTDAPRVAVRADGTNFTLSDSVVLNDGATATGGSDAFADVTSVDGANAAVDIVDGALAGVDSVRADLGAIQTRFESTISSLKATSENLQAARSRILDTDFAAETAALTRAQILQQAGVSMLAQANSLPQLALSLLQ